MRLPSLPRRAFKTTFKPVLFADIPRFHPDPANDDTRPRSVHYQCENKKRFDKDPQAYVRAINPPLNTIKGIAQ